MGVLEQFTDPHLQTYTRVPHTGPGVCDVCHSAPNPGFSTCYSCSDVAGRLSRPAGFVVPISLYEIPSQLHHVLRNYKREGWPAEIVHAWRIQIAAMIGRFLQEHGPCIAEEAGGEWDTVTVVPSTGGRTGEHPFERVFRALPRLPLERLLVPGPAADRLARRVAYDRGFAVVDGVDVEGRRILVMDDTYTSGARAQSAASALQLAGATVVAIVPVGRVVNPAFSEASAALWAKAKEEQFDFATCCLEAETERTV